MNSSEPLTPGEQVRWNSYQAGRIDIWAQLDDLYSDEIISDDKWQYWNEGFWRSWHTAHYENYWSIDSGADYDPDFRSYVNSRRAALAQKLH